MEQREYWRLRKLLEQHSGEYAWGYGRGLRSRFYDWTDYPPTHKAQMRSPDFRKGFERGLAGLDP